MRTSQITILTALAVATIVISAPAEAKPHHTAQRYSQPLDVAAIPTYPTGITKNAPRAPRHAGVHRRGGNRMASRPIQLASATPEPSLGQRTIGGYAERPADPAPFGSGLVTVSTAAGIDITVAGDFAPRAQAVIADAEASGIHLTRIRCFSAGGHARMSNHHSGRACDTRPYIPASIVRANGLRSGRDFHDPEHFDDATNVGGMAYWNHVRHGGPYAARQHVGKRHAARSHHRRVRYADRRASLEPTSIELSAKSRHHRRYRVRVARHYGGGRHSDGCSRKGDAAGINCQLRAWVRCSGGAVRVTTFSANSRRMCKQVDERKDGIFIIADKHKACGEQISIRNADTGKFVLATVGDRGPGTIAVYDLSHKTAREIGIKGSGCVYADTGLFSAGSR